ncbi:hypothetical protein [Pollutibacter soli]|uniref:hypothetical protein n=1 Tax=Pollutibacter soli TaxID=3034157 RepID=UPI0030138281
MFYLLGIFDPGWRDAAVRNSNTEITILWVLAAVIGFLLYHFFFKGRNNSASKALILRMNHLEKELHEEKNKHHKYKQQMEAAVSKANSFSAAATELDKAKHKLHDLHKELDAALLANKKLKDEFASEHAKVTSMMVDHGEVEAVRNRVKNQEKDLNISRAENLKLRSELEAALSEKVRLSNALNESQVAELKAKLQKLENDLHSSRLMVVKFQTETNLLEEERKKIRDESASLDERMKEIADARSKSTQLEADLQKSKQQLADLNEGRLQLQGEIDKWKQEADVQAKNAATGLDFQTKAIGLEAELKKLRAENEDLKIKASNGANAELNAIAASAESTHLQGQLADLRLKSGMLESDLVTLRQNYLTLEEKYSALQDEKEKPLPFIPPAASAQPDNLKRIEGIGPKLEEMLNEHDIYTFRQLAGTSSETLQKILDEGGEQYRIHDPATWPEQAKLLAEGKFEEFDRLTLELKGGRREN